MGFRPSRYNKGKEKLMKNSLLLLGVIAALAIGAPAYSQFIYADVMPGGDGLNSSADLLTSSSTGIDIYLDTNHNATGYPPGTLVNCNDLVHQLDMGSFDIVVHSMGSGSVTFNSFTPSAAITGAGFTLLNAFTVAGPDAGVGYTGPTYLAPGPYKLGTVNVTVTGSPVVTFIGTSTNASIPSFGTGFGSHCEGTVNLNTITLGIDFADGFGTASPIATATESTTWGKIKQLYR